MNMRSLLSVTALTFPLLAVLGAGVAALSRRRSR